jgi:16S rRNA (uracil1498-N3)-methyltransferase
MAHIPRIYEPGKLQHGPVTVEGDRARRIANVLRLRSGDRFIMFSGDGREWQVRVERVAHQRVHLTIEDLLRQEAASTPTLEIAIAVVRATRMDWAIEKCVEAGADAIRPLTTEHSVRGAGDSKGRTDRWERLVVEATEQCGRLYMASVLEPMPLETWMRREHGVLLYGDPDGEAWSNVAQRIAPTGRLAFVVGPEGGFSASETAALRGANGIGVRISPNVLRTETAAVVATALVRSMEG